MQVSNVYMMAIIFNQMIGKGCWSKANIL